MITTIGAFTDLFSKNVFQLSDHQASQIRHYHDLLVESNTRINLFSRKENNLADRHFANCACIAHFFKFTKKDRVLDIGSGAGFPGIVLKILFPQTFFCLTESVSKKAKFIEATIEQLQLKEITVVNDRVEKMADIDSFAKSFSFATARAVAALDKLVQMSAPLLSGSGTMLFLRGKSYENDLSTLSNKRHYRIEPLRRVPGLGTNQDGVLWISRQS